MGKPAVVVEPVVLVIDPALKAQMEKLAQQKEAKEKILAEDAAKVAAAKKKAAEAEQAILAKQSMDREKILKSPLSNEDQVDYQNLLRIANSGREQLTSMGGRRLADYRVRLKNNGVPNPQ